MKWEQDCEEELEGILEEYFPKQGDVSVGNPPPMSNRRGEALMLYAMAMSKIHKTLKAFGGCERCWGKGYGTQTLNIKGAADFDASEGGFDKEFIEKAPTMVFCTCDRGQQLERLLSEANITTN